MGVYYFYVNDSKKEFFCIDPTGAEIKGSFLGRNIGARALSRLILNNQPEYTGVDAHPLVGSWIGDHFFVTGDDYCENFDRIESEYTDIGQSVIEMLVAIQPYDLIRYGGVDWLIRLVESNGEHVTITTDMRKRMSHHFRHDNQLRPDDDLKRVIAALRKAGDK